MKRKELYKFVEDGGFPAVIDVNSTNWKYNVVSNSNNTDYHAITLDDSAWPVGQAPFANQTLLLFPPAPFNPIPNTVVASNSKVWLRKDFEYFALTDTEILEIELYCDDHYTVWINGIEIANGGSYAPKGDITDFYYRGVIPKSALVEGINKICVLGANMLPTVGYVDLRLIKKRAWTVTSADEDEVYNSEVYTSSTIGRDEVEDKNELSKANINVTVSIDDELGRRWMKSLLDVSVGLTIFNKDVETNNVFVVWKGRLTSVKPDASSIKLTFESVFTSLRRTGLRAKYQRSCPHVLYGRGCKLNKANFETTGPVSSVSGVSVVIPIAAAQADGYYNAGMIQAPDGSLRFVISHSGANLTLIRPQEGLQDAFDNSGYGMSYGLYYGQVTASIYPGCDRTKETCDSKFSNLDNYGGFPYIPTKNPLGGSSIV